MSKYRKKPVVIDAVKYVYGLEDAFGYKPRGGGGVAMVYDGTGKPLLPDPDLHGPLVPVILTLEGAMEISQDDWIITGVKGERYPCKDEIFAMTYEQA